MSKTEKFFILMLAVVFLLYAYLVVFQDRCPVCLGGHVEHNAFWLFGYLGDRLDYDAVVSKYGVPDKVEVRGDTIFFIDMMYPDCTFTFTSRYPDSTSTWELLKITLFSPKYTLRRGIRVGAAREHVIDVYSRWGIPIKEAQLGEEYFDGSGFMRLISFTYDENNLITSITICDTPFL